MESCEAPGRVRVTVTFFMESGPEWKAALANGPFIGVLLITDALVPIPEVADILAPAVIRAGQ